MVRKIPALVGWQTQTQGRQRWSCRSLNSCQTTLGALHLLLQMDLMCKRYLEKNNFTGLKWNPNVKDTGTHLSVPKREEGSELMRSLLYSWSVILPFTRCTNLARILYLLPNWLKHTSSLKFELVARVLRAGKWVLVVYSLTSTQDSLLEPCRPFLFVSYSVSSPPSHPTRKNRRQVRNRDWEKL